MIDATNNYTILIVDDEADIRSSLGGVLEDEGYNIVTAASGEEGLDKWVNTSHTWCCLIFGWVKAWTA